MKDSGLCILCGKSIITVDDLYSKGKEAMFCNNAECPRFGLFTAVSAPVKIPNEDKKS